MILKKIFITGANGYIGKRLTIKILEKGHSVTGAVRQLHGSNSQYFRQVLVGDISIFNKWNDLLHDCDCIIHLAARTHILNDITKCPIDEFRKVNRDATLQLAKSAEQLNVKRFVYLSSIGVLGNTTVEGRFNNKTKYNPKEAYAISKMEAEKGLIKIAELNNIEVVIVRPPLVYGPNAPGNFHRLLRLVDMGLPLPLGGLNTKKSMISLDNLCDLLIRTITTSLPKYNQFVVSDGSDWSTAELVKLIAKYIGNNHPLITVPNTILMTVASLIGKKNEIRKLAAPLQVDGSETARILNWYPVQSPEDGVKEAVEYYLAHK